MVLQVNNFTGFETRGDEEAAAVSGSALYSTAFPNIGSASLILNENENYDLPWVEGGLTDQGDDYIIGVAIRPLDKTPSAQVEIVQVLDSAGTRILALGIEADDDLVVINANGTTIRTISDPFPIAAYSYVEVHFQHTGTATVEVFINGISQGQDTSQDLTNGNSLNSSAVLRFNHDNSSIATYIDDVYILSGASSAADRFGPGFGVKMYQNTVEDATDQGGTLDLGTWAVAGQTPLDSSSGNFARYDDVAAAGDTITDAAGSNLRPGPSGDSAVVGSSIKAAKFIWVRFRGNGQGRTHFNRYGNSVDGIADTADLSLSTADSVHFVISELSTVVPTENEDFRIGFGKNATGGQATNCADQWATLAFVAPTDLRPHLVMAPYTPG